MFTSPIMFFSVYIPLVILAVFGIIFEERLISFEQKLKRAFLRKARRKGGKCRELSRSSAFESGNAEKHRKRAGRAA